MDGNNTLGDKWRRQQDYSNGVEAGMASLRPAISRVLDVTKGFGSIVDQKYFNIYFEGEGTDLLEPREGSYQPDFVLVVSNHDDRNDVYGRIEVSHIGEGDKRSYALYEGTGSEPLISGSQVREIPGRKGNTSMQNGMPDGMAEALAAISKNMAQERNIDKAARRRNGASADVTAEGLVLDT